MKTCRTCEQTKPESEFYRRSANKDGRYNRCADCAKVYQRAWNANNPEKAKAHRVKQHGLSLERYREIIADQQGSCVLCLGPLVRSVIDHDHACCPGAYSCGVCVRAVLCPDCNLGLGAFRDDPERLIRAAEYVRTRGVPRADGPLEPRGVSHDETHTTNG